MTFRWFYTLPLRLRSFFRRKQVDLELEDELRDHLEQQIKENLQAGMSAEDARYAALRAMGGMTQIEQQCRDARGMGASLKTWFRICGMGFDSLWAAARAFLPWQFCARPWDPAQNTAVFSWIEGILFRPYPAVAHQDRLLAVVAERRVARKRRDATFVAGLSRFAGKPRSLCDTFFVSKITSSTLNIGDRAEITTGSIVSANYFAAIGVHPLLGRGFAPGEDVGSNAHPVAVISYQLWRNRFKGDPQINLQDPQPLNNVPHTIIGVAPWRGFMELS